MHPMTKWYRENKHRPEVREAWNRRQRAFYAANTEKMREKGRKYTAEYRKLNPEKVKAATERCRMERGARNKAHIENYKRSHPCIRCGESDPIVLDFHHRDSGEKKFRIAAVIWSHKISAIDAEIAKCDVLCANCHRRAHYRGKDESNNF